MWRFADLATSYSLILVLYKLTLNQGFADQVTRWRLVDDLLWPRTWFILTQKLGHMSAISEALSVKCLNNVGHKDQGRKG